MSVTRIIKLVDGEELVSVDGRERVPATVADDPRRGALERRRAAERGTHTRDVHVLRDRLV